MKINQGYEPQDGANNDSMDRIELSIPKAVNQSQFLKLLWEGKVVDGRMGGTVIGKGLNNGPSRLIYKLGSEYMVDAAVDAGSFILNKEASLQNRNRIKCMNAGMTLKEIYTGEELVPLWQFIAATSYPHDKLIWVDFTQAVVNPEPAAKHVVELEHLNLQFNPRMSCDHYDLFGKGVGTADGIV